MSQTSNDFIINKTPDNYIPKRISEIMKLDMIEWIKQLQKDPSIVPTQIKS